MIDNLFKKMSIESQGICALILGLILMLGTLGKLQILQSILNSIMIFTGLILVLWGIRATKGVEKFRKYLQTKKK